MKLKSMQCPNCGGQLEEKSSTRFKCSSCLSEFKEEKHEPVRVPPSEEKARPYNPPPNPAPIRDGYKENQARKKNSRLKRRFAVVFIFTLLLTAIPLLIINDELIPMVTSLISGTAGQSRREKPESDAAISFAEQIFQKPMDQITAEELASIRYLEVDTSSHVDTTYREYWVFRYDFELYAEYGADYPAQEIMISNDLKLEKEDFSSFTGLEYLDYSNAHHMEGDYKGEGIFKNLENLIHFAPNSRLDLDDYGRAIKNKDKITSLGCRIRNDKEVKLIAEYPNLERLSVNYVDSDFDIRQLEKLTQLNALTIDLTDKQEISFLSSLTNLKELTLICTQETPDFSALNQLTNLEKLVLTDARSLKSIDYVKNMPNLKTFYLSNSKVQNLEALRDKHTLTSVELIRNNDLKDITALSSLPNLTALTCDYVLSDTKWSSLSGHASLTQAHIDAELMDMLANIGSMKKLTLVNSQKTEGLDGRFSQVEELTLDNVSFYDEKAFLSLPNLKVLRASDSHIDPQEGKNNLFRLPQLEELSLKAGTFTLDPAYIEGSENLKKLEFRNVTARIYRADQGKTSDEGLAPFQDRFSAFPNLEEFTAVSGKLNSVAFASSMPNLTKLDISDNYVSDVSPLTGLENLKLVGISDNPVGNKEAIPDSVVYLP